MPGLSVIIPNFNHAEFLPLAIDSSLRATAGEIEIIVVDDASTDASVSVVQKWSARHRNVRLLQHERNLGVEAALNHGLRAARHDFVLFRAADDQTLPGFVDEAIGLLEERHPEAPFCLGDTRFYSEDPARGRTQSAGTTRHAAFVAPQRWNEDFGGNELSVCSAIIRRSVMEKLGGFDPELRWVSDWAVLAELGAYHGFVYLPVPACAMRMNASSYNSAGSRDDARQLQIFARLLNRWAAFDDLPYEALLRSGILDFFATALRRLAVPLRPMLTARALVLLAGVDAPSSAGRSGCGMRAALRGFLREQHAALSHARAIALVGAGAHTAHLMEVWRETDLPRPVTVLTSAEPGVSEFQGMPVRVMGRTGDDRFDLIVISSKSYEPLLADLAARCYPGTPMLRIWT